MASGYYDITSKTLGKGHYGVVKLGRHCLTGEPVAMKIIEKSRLNKDSLNQLGTEIRILFRLSEYEHPNILKLYQTIDTQDKLFLVTEYCGPQACDLHDYLLRKDSRGGLSEKEAQIFFAQICSAISYCHSMGIVHRDLKPENILVTDYRHEYATPTSSTTATAAELNTSRDHYHQIRMHHFPLLKLIDFGFANQWFQDEKMTTSCGTLAYSAPELLLGEPYDGTKVDVWGLGLMLYILLYGGNPFMQINDNETLTKILDCSFATPARDNIDLNAVELLRSLIERNPEKRLPMDAILRHRWFSDITKPSDTPLYRPTSPDVGRSVNLSEEERKLHNQVIQEMFGLTKLLDSKSNIEASLKKARFAHRLFNQSSTMPNQLSKRKTSTGLVESLILSPADNETTTGASHPKTGLTDKESLVNSKLSNDDYIYATYQLIRDKLLRRRQVKGDGQSIESTCGDEQRLPVVDERNDDEDVTNLEKSSAKENEEEGSSSGGGNKIHQQRKLLQPQHKMRDKFTSFFRSGSSSPSSSFCLPHDAFNDHHSESSQGASASSNSNFVMALPLARKCSLVSEEGGYASDLPEN